MIAARIASDKPVFVGLISVGKFGLMFLAQAPFIAGLDVVAISDLEPERAPRLHSATLAGTQGASRSRFSEHGHDTYVDYRGR